ncbi:MAG: hypothetical protein LBM64_06445 [Deltaproteobacteria bacterium]|jgi:hypothetical protein|nr:hypothetical protein [Deltaproteobacteria bacterium]
MKKKLLILIVILFLGGGGAFLVYNQSREVEAGRAARSDSAAAAEQGGAENGASFAGNSSGASAGAISKMYIDGLDISQGEGGFLLWTLVAERAATLGEGQFQAERPFLTYFMFNREEAARPAEASDYRADPLGASVPEGASVLTVKSLAGGIDRQVDTMSFERQVVMVSEDKTLLSELLEYSGKSKTLTSPGPADFFSGTMRGKADKAYLDLTDSILYASGGVDVEWMMAPKQIAPLSGARGN